MITVFYHMYCLGDYRDRFERTITKIKSSGLYNNIIRIDITIMAIGVGNRATLKPTDRYRVNKQQAINQGDVNVDQVVNWLTDLVGDKLKYTIYNDYPELTEVQKIGGELVTLDRLYNYCKNDKNVEYILYLHSKGVTNPSPPVNSWVDYMEYFNIEKWEKMVCLLETGNNTAGCQFLDIKRECLHYSGNFWWARADWVITRPVPDPVNCTLDRHKHNPRAYSEFWITDVPKKHPHTNTFVNVHIEHIDMYENVLEKTRYREQ